MNSCSQNCGYTTADTNERFCPDCGAAMQAASGAAASAAVAPEPTPAPAPLAPPPPPAAIPMPGATTAQIDTRTVLFTIGLPWEDANGKKEFHLVQNGTFTVRRKLTDEEITDQGGTEKPADFYVPREKDGAVSASDPFVLSVNGDGKLVAEGGGANGFKISWVQSFVAHPGNVLESVPTGKPTMTIVVGAKTPFRIK